MSGSSGSGYSSAIGFGRDARNNRPEACATLVLACQSPLLTSSLLLNAFSNLPARIISARADFPRMSTLHGLLPLAGTGAFERGGNHAPRRVQEDERVRFYPAVHPPATRPPWVKPARKAKRRVRFPRGQRLFRATGQTPAMPRFSELVELSRFPKSLSRDSTLGQQGRIPKTCHRSHRQAGGISKLAARKFAAMICPCQT